MAYKLQDPTLYREDPRTGEEHVSFTEEEWDAMMATRESRIAFGYEQPCGCPTAANCGYQYGCCGVQEAMYDEAQYEAEEGAQ